MYLCSRNNLQTTRSMEYKIKHTLPEDIFVSCSIGSKDDGGQNGGRLLSGNQALDVIAALIHRYGHISCKQMAKILGVDERQISCSIALMSGITFYDWRDRYLVLMMNYVSRHEPKCSSKAFCHRMGFSCRSSRMRFEIRMNMKRKR